MKPTVLVMIGALLFAGCATQVERITHTATGKPERVFNTTDQSKMVGPLMAKMVERGYTLEKETPHTLDFIRPLKQIPLGMALSFGSNISSAWDTVSFMLIPTPDGIKVIATLGNRVEVGAGRATNYESMTNADFNAYQKLLAELAL